MKKILLTLALALTCCWASATTADDLFNKFKGLDNAKFMNLPQEMLQMAMAQASNSNDAKAQVAKKITSLDILQIEKADDATIKQVTDMVNDFDETYEELVRANENGEQAIIKMKRDGDKFTEMIIVAIEAGECAVVRMNGNFSSEDLDELSKMNNM